MSSIAIQQSLLKNCENFMTHVNTMFAFHFLHLADIYNLCICVSMLQGEGGIVTINIMLYLICMPLYICNM